MFQTFVKPTQVIESPVKNECDTHRRHKPRHARFVDRMRQYVRKKKELPRVDAVTVDGNVDEIESKSADL